MERLGEAVLRLLYIIKNIFTIECPFEELSHTQRLHDYIYKAHDYYVCTYTILRYYVIVGLTEKIIARR